MAHTRHRRRSSRRKHGKKRHTRRVRGGVKCAANWHRSNVAVNGNCPQSRGEGHVWMPCGNMAGPNYQLVNKAKQCINCGQYDRFRPSDPQPAYHAIPYDEYGYPHD